MELKMVEAIDEGRIVRVPEEYAVREGLMILRKPRVDVPAQPLVEERPEKRQSGIDALRKPLRYKQNDIAPSLVEHFQWVVGQKRRERNMTRKQLATAVQCSEHAIKMIENGILPADNYILINRIEKYFEIVLRKDGQDYQGSMRNLALSSSATSSAPVSVESSRSSSPSSLSKVSSTSVVPVSSRSSSGIAPAVRKMPEVKTSRWMERREQRELAEKEQVRASALLHDTGDLLGSDIELFDEDKR